MTDPNEKPPLFGRALLKLLLDRRTEYGFHGDVEELYNMIRRDRGAFAANRWFWRQVLTASPRYVADTIYWSFIMLKHFLKTAIRTVRRRTLYSAVNISGLAIGLACCLLILTYVINETGYDTFHDDADRIYRIVQDITGTATSDIRRFAKISPKVGEALAADYPEVERAARILPYNRRAVKYGDKLYYEDNIFVVDRDLLDILTIPLVSGNPETVLDRPGTVLVTEEIARKYFGMEDPIGKTFTIEGQSAEIHGIVKSAPKSSFWHYDILISMRTFENVRMMQNWHSTMFYTFVKLKPGVDPVAFDEKIRKLSDNYAGEEIKSFGQAYDHFLQPLTDIHFETRYRYEIEPPGNRLFVYVFSGIGLLILIIAGINFMNLSTALSATRAKEVGMRKVAGAYRGQLIGQFIGESVLFCLTGLLLSFAIAAAALPLFNSLSGQEYTASLLFAPRNILIIAGIGLLLGFFAGIYPAFFLSAFRPAAIIRGGGRTGAGGAFLRKVFVTGQFAISIGLIAATIIVYQQIVFMKGRDLGFDREQKLTVPFRGIDLTENYEEIKSIFSDYPGISAATFSSSVPGAGMSNFAVFHSGEGGRSTFSMYHLHVDPGFIPVYGIGMAAGRAFDPDLQTDVRGGFIVNEAAVRMLGLGSPEGAIGKIIETGYGGLENPIIGVAKDFHYRGLQAAVEPLVLEVVPETFDNLTFVVDTRNTGAIVGFLEDKWMEIYPDTPFEYTFVDELFDRQYRSEERMGGLFSAFTLIALFVSCLGLFGLASFTAQSRTKEIGIRKVLGASVSGVVFLLVREFLIWVSVGIVIAVPVSYIMMNSWLEGFAYRITPGVLPFAAAALLALGVAVLTVAGRSFRAASLNPADTLRHE